MITRRSILTGLGATVFAAPAIVQFSNLMPVRGIIQAVESVLDEYEEGRWTPTFQWVDGEGRAQYIAHDGGTYQRVGRVLTLTIPVLSSVVPSAAAIGAYQIYGPGAVQR